MALMSHEMIGILTSTTKKLIATPVMNDSTLSWGMAIFGASALNAWILLVGLDDGQDPTRSVPWVTAHVSTIVYALFAKPGKRTTVLVTGMATISTVLCGLYALEQFRTLF